MEKGIIFGSGYLGNRLAEELSYQVVPRSEVDATQLSQIRKYLRREKPSVVINAVGKTGHPGSLGIDGCKDHALETRASNIDAADNISIACEQSGSYFVHLGSGCIYQGDNNGFGFSEEDIPNFGGRQLYSDTKLEAESRLRTRPGLILRIRMPIDDRPNPRNLIDKLKGYSRVINIPNSMTTVPDMIVAMRDMIERRLDGIYNFVNPGVTSAAEIMFRYRELVNPNHQVSIMSLDDLNQTVTQPRSNCILSTEKLKEAGIVLPEIHVATDECLRNYMWASTR